MSDNNFWVCPRCERVYPDGMNRLDDVARGCELCQSCSNDPYPLDYFDDYEDGNGEDGDGEYVCCGARTSGGYCDQCGTQYG